MAIYSQTKKKKKKKKKNKNLCADGLGFFRKRIQSVTGLKSPLCMWFDTTIRARTADVAPRTVWGEPRMAHTTRPPHMPAACALPSFVRQPPPARGDPCGSGDTDGRRPTRVLTR